MNQTFRIILPKKGRLKDDFAQVLLPTGLSVRKSNPQLDYGILTDARNEISSVEALIQRPADALQCLTENVADMAILGLDTLTEFNNAARNRGERIRLGVVMQLEGISSCSLYIAGRKSQFLARESDLNGLRIATSYPETLKVWLDSKKIEPSKIITRDGGVEDTIRLNLADIICDVVQSGQSLKANNLVAKFKISDSNAVVVQRINEPIKPLARMILDRLEETRAAIFVGPMLQPA